MGALKTNLRFVLHCSNETSILVTYTGDPEVIENMKHAIEEFGVKHPNLSLSPSTLGGFEMDKKTYRAIQDAIFNSIP